MSEKPALIYLVKRFLDVRGPGHIPLIFPVLTKDSFHWALEIRDKHYAIAGAGEDGNCVIDPNNIPEGLLLPLAPPFSKRLLVGWTELPSEEIVQHGKLTRLTYQARTVINVARPANELCQKMGKYKFISNNCQDFANKLFVNIRCMISPPVDLFFQPTVGRISVPIVESMFSLVDFTFNAISDAADAVKEAVENSETIAATIEAANAAKDAVEAKAIATQEAVKARADATVDAVEAKVAATREAAQANADAAKEAVDAAKEAVDAKVDAAKGAVDAKVDAAKEAVDAKVAATRAALTSAIPSLPKAPSLPKVGLRGWGASRRGKTEAVTEDATEETPSDTK